MTDSEKSYIQQFKDKARRFWSLWTNLNQQRSTVSRQAPAVQAEYNDLLSRGSKIRSTIDYVTGAIDKAAAMYDSVKSWISETFGFGDIDEPIERYEQMGLIPLIPIAVIVAALAAITKWTSDAYEFNARLNEIQRLEAQGIGPREAAAIVERTMDKGIFGGGVMGNMIPLALLGVAALMILRKG